MTDDFNPFSFENLDITKYLRQINISLHDTNNIEIVFTNNVNEIGIL